jgi:hypothetical protein
MADTAKRAPYCYAMVDDKAGEGARLLDALRQAKVDLMAFHAFPSGGKSQLDLFARDGATLAAAAAKAGFTLSPTKTAFLIEGQDRVGAMAELLGKLSAAKINVTAAEGIAAGGGRFGALVWVKPADVERAAQALGAK